MSQKILTASFLIIGDEILSGRTQDSNLNFLAKNLTELGIDLREVRVVPDIEKEIIDAVNALRSKFTYVFTSGGIGPTHDDITSASIAKAFGDKLIKSEEGERVLIQYYGEGNVNEARLKMAFVPSRSTLLDNPISSAPGFRIENVFVMAGIPKIFQVMFFAAREELETGKKMQSRELKTNFTESVIAKKLTDLQHQFPQVVMGSYPFDGGTSLVFRSRDYDAMEIAIADMDKFLSGLKKWKF